MGHISFWSADEVNLLGEGKKNTEAVLDSVKDVAVQVHMLMSRHQTAGQIIMYRLVENPLKMLRS
jgi:hypothetical protein